MKSKVIKKFSEMEKVFVEFYNLDNLKTSVKGVALLCECGCPTFYLGSFEKDKKICYICTHCNLRIIPPQFNPNHQ